VSILEDLEPKQSLKQVNNYTDQQEQIIE